MNYKQVYDYWLNSPSLYDKDRQEIDKITDEKEIEERFYRELEFGTAGMRGILGIGTNRMNIYNVRRATMGVCHYVATEGEKAKKAGVLIGYDTRNFSKIFATETAKVLASQGVVAHLFPIVHSVPEVSFAIRELNCSSGVMITASHNPKEYNGYKVYGPDGGQLSPEAASIVTQAIDRYDVFKDVTVMDFDEALKKQLIIMVDPAIDQKFLDTIKTQLVNPDAIKKVADTFKFAYTPLHGTGSRPVQAILKNIGFKNVLVVKEQDNEDGNFPTVKSPNPEEKEGFTLAIELAKENDVDIIIGTDPDCDRVGIVVRDNCGEYKTLTGNQTGALLVDYILHSKQEQGTLPKNGVVIKSIVTTELATAIAQSYGVKTINVLTGFKYIGEKMTEYAKSGEYTYLIGFEESYGYLIGTHARDKDGVVSTMLIAEMAAYYKTKGISLFDALENIYKKYGYYVERTVSFTMPGKDGMEKMANLLSSLRENPPTSVGKIKISLYTDYQGQFQKDSNKNITPFNQLPKANVLRYDLADNKTHFIVRPSGTEPKIKIYLGTAATSMEEANTILDKLLQDLKEQFDL